MYRFYTFLCFILVTITADSQNTIDSLLNVIEKSTSVNERYSAVAKMTEFCELDEVPHYYLIADSLFHNDNLIKNFEAYQNKSNVEGNMGFYLAEIGELDSAINFYKKAIRIDKSILDFKSLIIGFINLASAYQDKGQNKLALEFGFRSLNLAKHMSYDAGISYALNIISKSYEIAGDYELTLNYQQRILKLELANGLPEDQAIAHNNIAAMYANLGKLDSAEFHYHKSLTIYQELENAYGQMMSYCNLGMFYIENKADLSKRYLKLADSLNVILGDLEWRSRILKNLSSLSLQNGDYNLGIEQGKKALQVAEKMNNPQLIMEATNIISQNALKANEYKLANEYLLTFYSYKDSLEGAESRKLVMQKELDYHYEKKKLSDSLEFVKRKELSDLAYQVKIDDQREQTYYLYVGLLFLGLLGALFYRNYSLKKRDNLIISEQKEQVELQKSIIEESHKEIRDSISYAQRIQAAILPSDSEFQRTVPAGFVLYMPKDVVAGDFYWIHDLSDRFLISAADCTGHGVPGAMVSVVCNNALNRSIREESLKQPSEILNKTRELVVSEFSKADLNVNDGMDLALVAVMKNEQIIHYAGANNPLWLIRNGSDEIEEFKADKQPIGRYEHAKPFTNHEIIVGTGDRIYLFSDGFVDQFGGDSGKKYKSKPFKRFLLSIQETPITKHEELIRNEFNSWKGDHETIDDVCVIGLEIT